jgi:hypothetical protein
MGSTAVYMGVFMYTGAEWGAVVAEIAGDDLPI